MKLAGAMVTVSLAPLTVVFLQVLELADEQGRDAKKGALLLETVAVADEVGRWARTRAEAIAGWTQLYPDLALRGEPVQTALLRAMYRAVPGAVTVALLDEEGAYGPPGAEVPPVWLDVNLPQGDPLANRPRGSPARAHVFLRVAPRPARPGTVQVGVPYRPPPATAGGPTPEPVVPISVRGAGGEIVAVELALDDIDQLLRGRSFGDRAFALVTSEGESVLAHGFPPDPAVVQSLLAPEATVVLRDARRIGAKAAVPGVPWSVVMTEPDDRDRIARQVAWQLVGASVLAFGVAAVTAILVGRQISVPVARLREGTQRLADGQYQTRVVVGGGGEIAELADTFNQMAARLSITLEQLGDRTKEVEALNAELQERVLARTRELERAQADLVRTGALAAVAEVGAGLAHELNNPLASVLGLVQLLKARATGPEQGLLARAEAEAQRCREVVDAMLRLSRAEEAAGQTCDWGDALTSAVRLVEGAFRARGQTIGLQPPPKGVRVPLGPDEAARIVAQVIQVLGTGLPDGASIQVHVEVQPTVVWTELTPDRAVAREERRDHFRASGLGLWVARRWLDVRGGRIEAPADGEGAWRVVLPRS
jgi:signal transduction histidine kinase